MQYIQQETAQTIVDTIKEICGHDINIIDDTGTIIASTNAGRIGDFHEIGHKVIETGETLEVHKEDHFWGTQPGVNMPIRYLRQIIGVVGITGEPTEVRKYARLAQRITLLLLREHETDTRTFTKHNEENYVIRSLLIHRALPQDYLERFLQEHDLKATDKYRVVLIHVDSRYNSANLPLIAQRLEAFPNALQAFHYPNEYSLLFPATHQRTWSHELRQVLEEFSPVLRAGVGTEETLLRQHHSYDAATLALRSLGEDRQIAWYEDLDIEPVVNSIPAEVKASYLQKTIAALDERDLAMLRLYYQNEMSLARTAEAMYVHKNTLQYRLQRVADKTGYDPRIFRQAAVLYMALRMK